MATDILMPALSPTMEQGKLAKWLKKEGDTVKPGDVLAEIETDKATMEVEAIDEGMLAKILVPDDTDNVAVNTPIAILAGEGEDVSAAAAKAPPRRRRSRTAAASRRRRPTCRPRAWPTGRRPSGGRAPTRQPGAGACSRAPATTPRPRSRKGPRWST